MAGTRTERIAPLSGVVFVVLVAVAGLLVNKGDLPPAEELHTFFTEEATRIQVAGYLGVLSAVFLIWFAGSVRHSLRPAEGDTGRLSAVAFGGGAVGGGLVALVFSILAAGGNRGGADGGIGIDAATLTYDLYASVLGVALPVTLAALIGAASVVAFRTRTWPTWLAWISGILAVGSITPVSYIFSGLDVLWILTVSIWLFTKERTQTVATPQIQT
ncbi:MAG TPA: hypothetical protein VGB33_03920 [Acidimicrobiia bacterium]|jgi:hypothetical protein